MSLEDSNIIPPAGTLNKTKKPSENGRLSVSSEDSNIIPPVGTLNKQKGPPKWNTFCEFGGLEYYPPCGDAQQNKKALQSGILFVSLEDSNIIPLRGRSTKQKSPPKTEDFFVSSGGLEPSTNGLKGHCSAIELRAHL